MISPVTLNDDNELDQVLPMYTRLTFLDDKKRPMHLAASVIRLGSDGIDEIVIRVS